MTSFSDLGLPAPVVRELGRQGITEPFPIQAAAIPDALAGRDVLGRGPTGSGKTFTFGLPMLARLEGAPSRPGYPRGLILAPTRELAAQTHERLTGPAAALGLRVLEVVGGVPVKRHITALAAPVDLLVATPGRAQDLIDQGVLHLDHVEVTAVDEADQMSDMGFLPQVRRLLDRTPSDGQRLLFSATLDGQVDSLVRGYLTDPVTHSTAPAEAAVDTMVHYRLLVEGPQERNAVAVRIAARAGRTIMFARTRRGVDRHVKRLRKAGVNAAGLHGDKAQSTRTRALAGFADGSVPVLVATDIAARGIDVKDVSLVVHVDPPAEHKAYLHRAGRTARAGTGGTVVTLVTPDQRDEVAGLLRKAGVAASDVAVTPDSPELVRITGARQPSGPALPPFGQQPPARDTHARGAHGAHGGGKGGARRNHRGRRNPRNQHGGRGRRDVGNRRKRQGGS
ncbi:DEAD/DEAH box helicase [Corynebacterium frankenforstense]|uniref:DEAD/DEAH box helicase n=1 Tax=Corynebacterium frankenforstense TaxID=1230998 RepID=UPI00254B8EF8|nr:DEAD/DEAH box helicase [Corynebacterium frankenforstense]MDK6260549.1 DEAD/DEAH box helicase [Corynebacterium frankenforstense]